MPTSATHQDILLLFREHPELVIDLARAAGVRMQRFHDQLDAADTEFDDPLHPGRTLRADLLVVASDAGKATAAIVFEIQLGRDAGKLWSMDFYRAAARYRHRCPTWTVVFSPIRRVITWARCELFTHEPHLAPVVITPELIQLITDRMLALADYPRAVLSTVMHGDHPHAADAVTVTIHALLRVAPRDVERYIQLVQSSVSEDVMQQAREQLPTEDQYELTERERRSAFYMNGLRAGREEGREEALQAAILAVLAARGFEINPETRNMILGCQQLEQLEALVARASTITALTELV